MRSASSRVSIFVALLAALLLAGCATRPTAPTEAEPPPQREPAMAEEARRALALDRPLEAAALFEAAADEVDSPLRDEYLIRAAGIYARGGDTATAARLIDELDPAALSGEPAHRLALARARIALDAGDAEAAWDHVRNQPADLGDALARDWQSVQAGALAGLGRYLEAARTRSMLAGAMPPGNARRQQFRRTWLDLTRLSPEHVAQALPSGSPEFDAWLGLVELFQTHRIRPNALESGVRDWQRRHRAHPGHGYVNRLLNEHLERLRPPEELALMLPLSGRLAAVGQAIKHGFMSAYFEDGRQRPRIRVFDVGESGTDVVSAYRDAVEAGVDMVVGPLTKQSLESLSVWDTFPVPVLALNTLGKTDIPSGRFFQFGLAPEDDARAAAALISARQQRTAVVLVPNSEWGDRVASAFRAGYEARDGIVLEQAYYQPKASDFGDPLTRLFNLDASRARYRTLQRVLSAEIEFEPRRRQDVDAVFFAAYPQQARLIRPQIRFHHGIELAVYATSHAYSGQPQPDADQDMDGLRIVDIPWLLGPNEQLSPDLTLSALAAHWPDERARFARLMAMGIDAYSMAPLVDVLRQYPGEPVPAATGWLQVDARGVLHRLLTAAQFRDGRLSPLALESAPFGGHR